MTLSKLRVVAELKRNPVEDDDLIKAERWMDIGKALVLVALCAFVAGCSETAGRRGMESEHVAIALVSNEETLEEQASSLLSALAVDRLNTSIYPLEWLAGSETVHKDVDRFPAWAQERYEACFYWQQTYAKQAINRDRRPGNSAVHVQLSGKAWGWILVGESDAHILELSHQHDYLDEPETLVDGWNDPQGDDGSGESTESSEG